MMGIAPLNFQSMKDRAAWIEESACRNQDTISSHRSVLDAITAAKMESDPTYVPPSRPSTTLSFHRTQLPEEQPGHADQADLTGDITAEARAVDQLDIIEANACKLREKLQARADSSMAEEDVTMLKADPVDDFEAAAKAQAEARQYILFGIKGVKPSTVAACRPSSAPAGARGIQRYIPARPSSGLSTATNARPVSAATTPARPSSGVRYGASRPGSAMSGDVAGSTSRPYSANSMRARMKALEENVARNTKTLTNNRDGIEVVKKRRAEASQAMAQLLVDLKPVSES